MPKIILKRSGCIGCGVCASIYPKFFEMSADDGLANLKNSKEKNGVFELETEEAGCAKEAVDCCPVKVISVEN